MRKILSALLVLSIIFSLSACNFAEIIEPETEPYIAFSNEAMNEDSTELMLTPTELLEAELLFDDFRDDFHWSLLSDSEKKIYRALEYALENGYTYIYIDKKLADSDALLSKATEYLSLDSPLLEQNLRYELGNFSSGYYVEILGFIEKPISVEGFYISLENFAPELLAKRKEAIKEAKKIAEKISPSLTVSEKAEKIYYYILNNVEYRDYTSDAVYPYLYDAVIGKKSHCDGVSNMYSLILNMLGIRCFEKQYSGSEEDIGHTWNMVELDGKWYNVDATPSNDSPGKHFEYLSEITFGFEDKLQSYTPDYEEIYPSAKGNLKLQISAEYTEVLKYTFIEKAEEELIKNKNKTAFFVFNNFSKTEFKKVAEKLVDRLQTDLSWYEFELIDGKTAVLLVK